MDKRKISVSDETDAPRKKANKESETKDPDALSQQIAALKLDRIPWTEFAPESKKRRVDSDNQLEVDKGGSIWERTLKVTPADKNSKNPVLKYSDNELETYKGGSLRKRTFQITPKVNRDEYEKAGKYIKIPVPKYSDNQLEVDKGGNLWERKRQVTPKANRDKYEKAIAHEDPGKHIKIPVLKYSDNQLEVDKGGSLWERTLQITPKVNREEYEKAIGHEDDDKNIKNPVLKNFRRRMKNPSEALKNIKCKILKVFKFNSTEILEKEQKGISEMDKSNEMSEGNISEAKLEGFKNVKSRVTNFRKTKDYWLSKLNTMSEASTKSNDVTLPSSSTQYSSSSITQYNADSITQTSENRSSKEVWEHFRNCLQSGIKSPDRMETDDVNKEDMELSPEYRIHSLEYPMAAEPIAVNRDLEQYAKTTKSMYRNLNDITTEVMEYSLIKNAAGKVKNKVSAYQVDSSTIISARNPPRQRIVYNETHENDRNWVLAFIKDREIMLKFAIMEGRFEEDFDKKMAWIEEAEDIQYDIDSLFDTIDEYDREASYLKQSKHPPKHSRFKDHLENFRNLFRQLYKPSSFEYRCGDLFKRIDATKFGSAVEEYIETEENLQCVSDMLEETVMKAVNQLYLYLAECRLVRKGKMPLAGNRSLRYYQNFIDILETAVDHNLDRLREIISLADDVLPFPLFKHLSESYKKYVRIIIFLNKERPDVFSKWSDDNRAFFEEFCQRISKTDH